MAENDQNPEDLTPKQDQLIELLLAGVNVSAAARQLKIGDKTARRWLKLPHFQAAYKTAQRALFDQALTGLMNKVDKAIGTLDRNMDADINTPASTQVRAAQIVLEQAINVHKVSELETRLAELEERLKGG
jgi:hypothetical protein